MALKNLICTNCKKQYSRYIYSEPKRGTFCSSQCSSEYGRVDRTCIECDKSFQTFRSELKKCKGAGSFCSKECQANGHLFMNCQICNKEFKAYKSDLERGNKRFCSQVCYNKRTNPIENFFKNISKTDHPNGCWIWEGRKDKDGYGIIYLDKNTKAHRYSIEMHGKKVPHDMLACHQCDTPSCVNPEHIFIRTSQDNARDRDNKGRGYLHNKYICV